MSTTFRRIAATTLIAGSLATVGAGIATATVQPSVLVPDVAGDTVATAEAAFTAAGFRDVTLSTQVADPTVSTVTGSNNVPNTYQFVDDVIVLDVAFPAQELPHSA